MSIAARIDELRYAALSPEAEVERGSHAARLLEDEVLRAAAAQVELDALSAFFKSTDPEIRDGERVKALAVELIFDTLRSWAGDAEYQHARSR